MVPHSLTRLSLSLQWQSGNFCIAEDLAVFARLTRTFCVPQFATWNLGCLQEPSPLLVVHLWKSASPSIPLWLLPAQSTPASSSSAAFSCSHIICLHLTLFIASMPVTLHVLLHYICGPLLWSLPDTSMFCTNSLYLNFTSCHLHCSLIFLSCTHGSCLVSTDCFIPLFSSAYLHLSGFSPTCSLLSLQITIIIDGDSCLPDLMYPPVHHHCKTTLLPHASISLSSSCLTYFSATPDSNANVALWKSYHILYVDTHSAIAAGLLCTSPSLMTLLISVSSLLTTFQKFNLLINFVPL